MNRSYNLKLDLQFRCNNSTIKFNQFDNNTSDFFMRITNGGNLVDIEKAIVVLAVIKPSGKIASQFVEVKNGLIYADLKPNMRDEIGTYTAQAMLILEDERVVTDAISYEVEEDKIFSLLNDSAEDTEEFTLLIDMLNRLSTIETSEEQRMINEAERILSEENRKIEEAKRVEAELIRQHEEADRSKYDATRESNENIRKINEVTRQTNEDIRIQNEANRIDAETKRIEAEQLRKDNYNFMTEDEERRRSEANAHKEAENLRVQAETNRVNEEAKRRTTEQARVSTENIRVSNENTREANEITRKSNETKRVEAETQRQNRYNSFISDAEANANNFENYTNTAKVKEEERKSNELDRKSQEDRRVSNEVERISNENTRKANEVVREKNEASRQNTFTNKVSEIDEKISELNTTKDNFVSSINTKVNNKISELDSAKSDMTTTVSNKVNEVETRFNALTASQQQDAEVIDARDGETSLKARLDRDIEKAKQVYVNVEGSHISTDSASGYLKDVEILGNTVQDASNLADIRSVGDKVEGQELYEIPVLSVGKNLINKKTLKEMLHTYIQDEDGSKIKLNYVSMTSNRFEVPLSLVGNYTISYQCKETVGGKNPKLGFRYSDGSSSYNTSFVATSNYSTYNHFSNGKDVVGLCITYNNTGGDFWVDLDSIQLEEGTIATLYESYQEDKLTILSPVQLEKVGDVADRIIEKDGVLGVEKNTKLININDLSVNNSVALNEWKERGFRINFRYTNDIINNTSKVSCMFNGILSVANSQLHNSTTFPNVNSGGLTFDGYIRIHLDIPLEYGEVNSTNAIKYLKDLNLTMLVGTTNPQFIPLPHDQQVKLRTFANKTNISFLTEIEGIIKAQVPKSLGATVNTHTEQISNLNKELDRIKKLEESTVSTVTTESDFTTVEATSNGYFEDVKLEGKTLVNCLKLDADWFNTETTLEASSTNYVGLSTYNKGWDLSLLKDNTTYTVIPFVDYTVVTQGEFYVQLNTEINGVSNSLFRIYENMFNKPTLITTKELTNKNYKSLFIGGKNCSYKVRSVKILILEGDHTQNPPSYFEGLKSVGQSATTSEDGADEIVVSSVKGDGNLIKSRLIFNDNEQVEGFSSVYRQFKIPVIKGRIYYLKAKVQTNSNWKDSLCRLYHQSKPGTHTVIYVSTYNNNLVDIDISFVANDDYVVFEYYNNPALDRDKNIYDNFDYLCLTSNPNLNPNIDLVSDKKCLLFYNEETQSWEKPILREWDSIEKHSNGKYYYHQRSEEKVLNGSENWVKPSAQPTSGTHTRFIITNFPPNVIQAPTSVLCDKYNNQKVFNESSVGIYVDKNLNITVNGIIELETFKSNLQTNPITVVYQLAQEKVYECTNIDLITYANETNYIVESGPISPKSILKVHNNISNVVSLLQKKVSILESNMTKYMITQNRLMLTSRYNADTVGFKVDVASYNNSFEYDNDLYELILNNILVGKDNYDREYIENLIIFYWMDFVISDEMHSTLFEIIEEQHNPKVIEEETPLI